MDTLRLAGFNRVVLSGRAARPGGDFSESGAER
jgi:hypothetical protein